MSLTNKDNYERESHSNINNDKPGRFNSLRFVIGVLISLVCIYYLFEQIEISQLLKAFSMADRRILLLAFFITLLSYLVRAFRWRFLFVKNNIPFFTLYRSLSLGFFMNNILPARAGEIVRAHSLGKNLGISRTFVLATVAAERLADGLTISLIFGIAYFISGEAFSETKGLAYVALMFLAASSLIIILLILRKKIFEILEGIDGYFQNTFLSFTLERIRRFISGLEPLFKPDLILRVTLLSIVVWGVELFVYYLITIAFDVSVSFSILALFLAAVNFSSLIPAAPGGIGVIETFATLALVKVGLGHELALAMVVSQHSIQYIAVAIPGVYYSLKNKP